MSTRIDASLIDVAAKAHDGCGAGGINQSRGPWLRVSQFPSGWQETAKHFRPLEYIFPASWEETVCLVLHGYPQTEAEVPEAAK